MELSTILEWSFTATGLLGASLLATYSKYAPWGWVAFLITNIITICFAISQEFYGLTIQQVFFCATSIWGIYRSGLFKKNREQNKTSSQQMSLFETWWSINNLGKHQRDKDSASLGWDAAMAHQISDKTCADSQALVSRRIKALSQL